jgi:hypothetical protein
MPRVGGVGAVGVGVLKEEVVAAPAWKVVARAAASAKDRGSAGVGEVLGVAGVAGKTAVVAVECGPTARLLLHA